MTRQVIYTAIGLLLSVLALRFAYVAFEDFGEVPLRLNIATWLIGLCCAGAAVRWVLAGRRFGLTRT